MTEDQALNLYCLYFNKEAMQSSQLTILRSVLNNNRSGRLTI